MQTQCTLTLTHVHTQSYTHTHTHTEELSPDKLHTNTKLQPQEDIVHNAASSLRECCWFLKGLHIHVKSSSIIRKVPFFYLCNSIFKYPTFLWAAEHPTFTPVCCTLFIVFPTLPSHSCSLTLTYNAHFSMIDLFYEKHV